MGNDYEGAKKEVRGNLERGAGKVKEEIGDVTGNPRMEREGQLEQAKGDVRRKVGEAERKLD